MALYRLAPGHSFDYYSRSAFFLSRVCLSYSRGFFAFTSARTYAGTHVGTCAESTCRRAAQCQRVHTYVCMLRDGWKEKDEFRCVRRGRRLLSLLTMTADAACLVLYFLGVSRASQNTFPLVAFGTYEMFFDPGFNVPWVQPRFHANSRTSSWSRITRKIVHRALTECFAEIGGRYHVERGSRYRENWTIIE